MPDRIEPTSGESAVMWAPQVGEAVWFNFPDSPDPLGVVEGFVSDEMPHRKGQPIIRRSDGTKSVCHPMFLLPFPCGGEKWKAAQADGRVV